MSAVSVSRSLGASGPSYRPSGSHTGLAPVIDLDAERRRRIASGRIGPGRDALEDAVRRHPAGSYAANASSQIFAAPVSPVITRPAQRVDSVKSTARSAASAHSTKRLLRKAAVWTLATVLTFSGALGLGLALRPAPYQGETWQHTVTAGDSVWGLAAGLESGRPLAQVVEDIKTLNQLDGAAIYEGQVLQLPLD